MSSDGTAIGSEIVVNFQISSNTGNIALLPDILVTPEYNWAGLLALIVCFSAFMTFTVVKRGIKICQIHKLRMKKEISS